MWECKVAETCSVLWCNLDIAAQINASNIPEFNLLYVHDLQVLCTQSGGSLMFAQLAPSWGYVYFQCHFLTGKGLKPVWLRENQERCVQPAWLSPLTAHCFKWTSACETETAQNWFPLHRFPSLLLLLRYNKWVKSLLLFPTAFLTHSGVHHVSCK